MLLKFIANLSGFRRKNRHSQVLVSLLLKVFFLYLCLPLAGFGQSAQKSKATISGRITDSNNQPLELAHIQIKETASGDVTDKEGFFSLTTELTGLQMLVITYIGFETREQQINIKAGEKYNLTIVLKEKLVDLKEAEITASSYTTGTREGVTLSPLEVVTTPGAAADIFKAFKSFPGVSTVDEGSGLFVRGGDVSETKFLLDQATVEHPFRFESPTGGSRGTISPFLVEGTNFSSGGFPARYGNALSAVLAMESQGMPDVGSVNTTLSMASTSAELALPLVQNKLGLRFSGNRSFTRFLFEVNGLADEFEKAPRGLDANISLIYKPSHNTTIKFFNFGQQSEIGVRAEEPAFEGLFSSDETNRLHNLQWEQIRGDWLIKTSFSMNRFDSQREFGGLNLTEEDDTYKIRTDVDYFFSDDLRFLAGAEWNRVENSFSGSVPDREDVLDPNAGFNQLSEQFGIGRIGTYAELEFRLNRNILGNIGLRSDINTQTGEAVLDPRFSLQYQFNKYTNLRAATGLFHQFPEPFQFNTETGNPNLEAQQAWHYILGLEHKKNLLHLRLEGYFKDYDNLVIDANTSNLSNRGFGKAWGADVFIKYSEYLRTRFNGWISYSYLQSDRFLPQDLGNRFTFNKVPSDFDITHNLNIVGKVRLVDNLYLGGRYRLATGRPVTPIEEAVFVEEQGFYQPIEGRVNSIRLPGFQRLDVDLNYFWPFTDTNSVVFFLSVSNALDRKNITDYTYNEDFSERKPVFSNFSRSVFAGVTVNLGLEKSQ